MRPPNFADQHSLGIRISARSRVMTPTILVMLLFANSLVAQEDRNQTPQTRRTTQPRESIEPTASNVPYGSHARNVLDFWKADSSEPTPVIVYIHGGGFRGGDKSSFNERFLTSALDADVSFAAIHYRLSQDAIYPAAMHDSARAIQFIRSKATEWNIDPKRIAAFGGSAGSGISQWLAFHDDLAEPDSEDPVSRESTRLTCAVAQQMQSTYDPRVIKQVVPGKAYQHTALVQFFGVPADFNWDEDTISDELSELLRDASPITHLTKDDPPVFLFHRKDNERDGDIHHSNFGRHMKKAMDRLGIECHHKMDSDYDTSSAAIDEQVNFMIKHLKQDDR